MGLQANIRFILYLVTLSLLLSIAYWYLTEQNVPKGKKPFYQVERKNEMAIRSAEVLSNISDDMPDHSDSDKQRTSFSKIKSVEAETRDLSDKEVCRLNCLYDLKAQLFNASNGRSETKEILNKIAISNSTLAVQVLLESLILANDASNHELLEDIYAVFKRFDTIEEAKILVDSLLETKYTMASFTNLPEPGKNLIVDIVNNIQDREHIVPVLSHAYMESEGTLEGFFSGLDFPEIYSIVAIEAENRGDYGLKEKALNIILTNSGKNAIPSLILFSRKNNSSNALEESFKLAKDWGYRYATPKTMEVAKSLINSWNSDINTKVVAIALLSNMEDEELKMNIFSKIRQYSEDATVNSYIDYSFETTSIYQE